MMELGNLFTHDAFINNRAYAQTLDGVIVAGTERVAGAKKFGFLRVMSRGWRFIYMNQTHESKDGGSM